MTQKLDPVLTGVSVSISAAAAAGSIFAPLSLAAGTVIATGAVVLGTLTGAWIWYRNKKMTQAIKEKGLTPTGNEPYACGTEARKQASIENQEERE